MLISKWRGSPGSIAALVSIAIFCDMLVYGIFIPTLPEIAKDRGISQELLGVYLSSYSIGMIISPGAALLSDYLSNRKVPMVSSSILLGISSYLFASGTNQWSFLFARTGQGIAGCVSWMIAFSMLAEAFPENELGNVMGSVMAANTMGNLLGPPLGGGFHDAFGKLTPLYLSVAICCFDTIIRTTLLPTIFSFRYDRLETLADEESLLDSDSDFDEVANESTKSIGILKLLKNWEMIITLVAIIAGEAVLTGIEPTLPVYLTERFELSSFSVGLIWTFISIPKMLASYMAGTLSDLYGRKIITRLGLIIFTLACILLAVSTSIYSIVPSLALFGVGAGVALTPGVPEMGDIARKQGDKGFGTVYALYNIASSSGMLIGPIIGSWSFGTYGFHFQSILFACILSITFSIMQIFSKCS
jgi:MFS family permease